MFGRIGRDKFHNDTSKDQLVERKAYMEGQWRLMRDEKPESMGSQELDAERISYSRRILYYSHDVRIDLTVEVDDDCESTAHIFSDYSNKSISAVIQTNIAQESLSEVEQKTSESSKEKRFRKKRRRRRHKRKDDRSDNK